MGWRILGIGLRSVPFEKSALQYPIDLAGIDKLSRVYVLTVPMNVRPGKSTDGMKGLDKHHSLLDLQLQPVKTVVLFTICHIRQMNPTCEDHV